MKNELVKEIIGFFVAKGLLIDPTTQARPKARLNVRDVLQAAEEIEPRLYEVLPAALIHFPRSFEGAENLPDELKEMIAAIRRGEVLNQRFRGISHKDMMRWANIKLKDRRTKPESMKRKMVAYRLRPETKAKLAALSVARGVSETAVIEDLIHSARRTKESR